MWVWMCVVSENKVLTHPSSVDSISTSAAQEDHVSMGGFSARKAIRSELITLWLRTPCPVHIYITVCSAGLFV